MLVGRMGDEARIFDRFSDGEVVQALIVIVCQSQYFVNGIVKETPDAGAPNPVGFCRQIQNLADHAAFPEKLPVGKGVAANRVFESRNHPH